MECTAAEYGSCTFFVQRGGKMINIVICDDEKKELDRVYKILEEIFTEHHLDFQIQKFTSSEDVLNKVTQVDIGIFDI